MALEFPFVEVGKLELAFPVVPNYQEVLDALPDSFSDEEHLFLSAAERWFYGTFDPQRDLPGYFLNIDDIEEAQQKRDYIQVWAGTYQPKHQKKIEVIAWLLSLTFEKTE